MVECMDMVLCMCDAGVSAALPPLRSLFTVLNCIKDTLGCIIELIGYKLLFIRGLHIERVIPLIALPFLTQDKLA